MADDNRTEKPSPRKLNKAREDGNYVVSKEFIAAVQFTMFFAMVIQFGDQFGTSCRVHLTTWLGIAFSSRDLHREYLHELFSRVLIPYLLPILGIGFLLTGAAVLAQLLVSRLGISAKKLAPQFNRLNPLSRLKELPKQNFVTAGQAALLLPVFLGAIYLLVSDNATKLLSLPSRSAASGATVVFAMLTDLLYKATFVFLLVGVVDWYRQQSRYTKQLKMTKQEVKDEHKESEGNPQLKAKLRKMQRDNSRRQMITNVPKASAIIVNPTHYSVAIRYELGGTGAPKVVAKGKNYLARRIREIATANEIPIVENPPLARALYAAVDVGQEIPPHLYRAVAEILAYLFRIMGGRLPGSTNA
jgi:flagellar biosynthetic protein FlhB